MAACRLLVAILCVLGLATSQVVLVYGAETEKRGTLQPDATRLPRALRQKGSIALEDVVEIKEKEKMDPRETLAQVRIMRRADSSSGSGSSSSSSDSLDERVEAESVRNDRDGSSEEDREVVEQNDSSSEGTRTRRSKYDVVYDPDDQSTWTLDGSSTVVSFGGSAPASEVLSSLSSRHRKLKQVNEADLSRSEYFTTLASELAEALDIFPEWILFDNIRIEGEEVLYDVQVLLPAGLPQDDIDNVTERLANPDSLNLSVPLQVTTPISTSTIDNTELFPVDPNDDVPAPPPTVPEPTVPVPTVPAPSEAPPTSTQAPPVSEEPTQMTQPTVAPPDSEPPSATPAPTAPMTSDTVDELNVDDRAPSPPPPPSDGGLPTGAVIAIIVVVAVLLGVSIGLFSYFSYKKKKGAATTGTWTANPASEAGRGVITPVLASAATTPRDPAITPRHVLKYPAAGTSASARSTDAHDSEPLKQTAMLKPTTGTISGEEFEAPSPMMTKSPEYDGLKSFPILRDGVLNVTSSESGSSTEGHDETSRASTSRV